MNIYLKIKCYIHLMPAKKTQATSEKKSVEQPKVEVQVVAVQTVEQSTEKKFTKTDKSTTKSKPFFKASPKVEDENDENSMVRKAGRTLLVSSSQNSPVKESSFSSLKGLTNSHSTSNGSYFLTFDTVQNSLDSFRTLRESNPEFRVKFARYQLFFTLTGLTDSSDYSAVKSDMTSFVEKEAGANVLFFKLYRKGEKYLGCGDMTVDTKDTMDKLLNKESTIKNFTVGTLTGTFYRYNKTQTNNQTGNAVSSA